MKKCGIYCIRNIKNDKRYIGRSLDIRVRWNGHKSDLSKNKDSIYLQREYNIFGKESFEYSIIEECLPEELNDREKYWIKELRTFRHGGKFGYNLTEGGDGCLGYIPSQEHRDKMSKIMSGENNYMFGKHLSDEAKKKIGAAHLGMIHSEESREKMSLHNHNRTLQGENSPYFGVKKKGCYSDFIGVTFHKFHQKWIALIIVNKKKFYLGYFDDEISAAKARDKYIIENNLPHSLAFPKDYPNR